MHELTDLGTGFKPVLTPDSCPDWCRVTVRTQLMNNHMQQRYYVECSSSCQVSPVLYDSCGEMKYVLLFTYLYHRSLRQYPNRQLHTLYTRTGALCH